MKVKIKNPKFWVENELKKLIAKHIIKYMDEWLLADDVRLAVENAREEMLCIAYELAPRELADIDESESEFLDKVVPADADDIE